MVIGSKQAGVYFSSCKYNLVAENDLFNNSFAIYFTDSSNNTIYHNNCLSTELNIFIRNLHNNTTNTLDDGYPSGGNYYTNYAGRDRYSGSYQNETQSDGIGDTLYKIEGDTQDNYPLMGMHRSFNVISIYSVQTISNSTISGLNYNGTVISFYVSGDNGTTCFCRIYIPTALMNGTYKVFINGTEAAYQLLSSSNNTHSYLYFTYDHSIQDVIIVPKISCFLSMLVFMIGISAIIVCRKNDYYC